MTWLKVCAAARFVGPMLGLALGLTDLAHANQADRDAPGAASGAASAGPDDRHRLPEFQTTAPTGFRMYHPGYRLAGKGAVLSVQICRLPLYAGAGPQRLRVERVDPAGHVGENHEQHLARLGKSPGNNCSLATMSLEGVPAYGETIKICAISGRASCP